MPTCTLPLFVPRYNWRSGQPSFHSRGAGLHAERHTLLSKVDACLCYWLCTVPLTEQLHLKPFRWLEPEEAIERDRRETSQNRTMGRWVSVM